MDGQHAGRTGRLGPPPRHGLEGAAEFPRVCLGVPLGDPDDQPAAVLLVDGEAVAPPAGRGGVGLLAALEILAEEDPQPQLPHLPLGRLAIPRQLLREVREAQPHGIVPLGVPLLGMEDLLRRARRVRGERVVEQHLASQAPGAHAEREPLEIAEHQGVPDPGGRGAHLLGAGEARAAGEHLLRILHHAGQDRVHAGHGLEAHPQVGVDHGQRGVPFHQGLLGGPEIGQRVALLEPVEIEMLVLERVRELVDQHHVLALRLLSRPRGCPGRVDQDHVLAVRIVESGHLAAQQLGEIAPQVHRLRDQAKRLQADLESLEIGRGEILGHLRLDLRLELPRARRAGGNGPQRLEPAVLLGDAQELADVLRALPRQRGHPGREARRGQGLAGPAGQRAGEESETEGDETRPSCAHQGLPRTRRLTTSAETIRGPGRPGIIEVNIRDESEAKCVS